jgi:hypothetical protein
MLAHVAMTRHAKVVVTEKYGAIQNAADLGEELWAKSGPGDNTGNSFGNIVPETPPAGVDTPRGSDNVSYFAETRCVDTKANGE